MNWKVLALGAVALAGAGLVFGLTWGRAPMPEPTDGAIALPSGRAVAFGDVIWSEPGTEGLAVRFRFIEPDLAQTAETIAYEVLEADMHFLCETYALERIANTGPQPAQIVVSVSDRPVDFGAADPDATQIFESYRPEDGACIWEGL